MYRKDKKERSSPRLHEKKVWTQLESLGITKPVLTTTSLRVEGYEELETDMLDVKYSMISTTLY